MTVELAAAFPVLIIVAVIAVNALAFFSECAAFDNVFRDAVRVHATSPAAGQGIEQSSALVQTALSAAFDAENEAVRVSAEGVSGGHTRFTGTLEYMPTLFGRGCGRRCSDRPAAASMRPASRSTVTSRGAAVAGRRWAPVAAGARAVVAARLRVRAGARVRASRSAERVARSDADDGRIERRRSLRGLRGRSVAARRTTDVRVDEAAACWASPARDAVTRSRSRGSCSPKDGAGCAAETKEASRS
ncbi:MAG: hypothetical protein ACLTMP_01895 [Eggerthella lenta]